jgi:hypothetical protein
MGETVNDLDTIDVEIETEIIDGYIVDQAGEVLGLADTVTGEVMERFEIASEGAADWVLKLFMEEEARLEAIAAKRAAILANLDGQEVGPRNRLRYLGYRFHNDLAEWARKELAAKGGKGGRGKTVKLDHGSIAFRKSDGSCEITSHDAALSFVSEWAPSQVKRSVGIMAVKAAIVEAEDQLGEAPDVSEFFRSAEPRESVVIKTGVGAGMKGGDSNGQ